MPRGIEESRENQTLIITGELSTDHRQGCPCDLSDVLVSLDS